jgi:AcrR family transcriptional regulator
MPKIVDHNERRVELIDALWRAMDADPTQIPSVRAVAAAAGVSKTNIGHYFESQGQFLAEAALSAVHAASVRVRATDLSSCSLDDAAKALATFVGDSDQHRRRNSLLLQVWSLSAHDPTVQHVAPQIYAEQAEAVEYVLTALRARRLVHRSRDLAVEVEMTVTFINGLAAAGAAMPVNFPPARVSQLVHTHLRQLSARLR